MLCNLELNLLINEEGTEVAMLVDFMVFPKRVAEEGFQYIVLIKASWIETIHQVGVVEQHAGWLLRELVALAVNHVDQSCLFEIFDVVHYCSTAHAKVLRQLAHVGNTAAAGGEHIEELLNLGQILELDLLDEQDVYLYHHIHVLQQVLAIVGLVEEEGVEAVVQVCLEIFAWIYF